MIILFSNCLNWALERFTTFFFFLFFFFLDFIADIPLCSSHPGPAGLADRGAGPQELGGA